MFCLQNCEVPAQVEPQDNTTMTGNAEVKLIAVTSDTDNFEVLHFCNWHLRLLDWGGTDRSNTLLGNDPVTACCKCTC